MILTWSQWIFVKFFFELTHPIWLIRFRVLARIEERQERQDTRTGTGTRWTGSAGRSASTWAWIRGMGVCRSGGGHCKSVIGVIKWESKTGGEFEPSFQRSVIECNQVENESILLKCSESLVASLVSEYSPHYYIQWKPNISKSDITNSLQTLNKRTNSKVPIPYVHISLNAIHRNPDITDKIIKPERFVVSGFFCI